MIIYQEFGQSYRRIVCKLLIIVGRGGKMKLKKWTSRKKIYIVKKNGGENMETTNIRDNKLALKALLMKNVKTDNIGRVVITKDDEWRNETEWDELYNELKRQ